MINNNRILAVVPARKNSKEIPNKNLKLFDNIPLIGHTLKKLQNISIIDKIVVTTDCDEITNYCKIFKKVEIKIRNRKLAKDSITLDPVVLDVIKEHINYDYMITFQPTSPLLSEISIIKGIQNFIKSKKDTLISCSDARHLIWYKKNKSFIPFYKERVNRQNLSPLLKETGGMIGCKLDYIKINKTRINQNSIYLFEIDNNESIDIDSYNDWILAEEIKKQKKIGIILIGNKKKGLGHVFSGLSFASKLRSKPIFFIHNDENIAIERIKQSNYPYIIYENLKDLEKELYKNKIKIILNDTLDTQINYLKILKSNNRFVVTFEDLGEGSEIADLSFNALYENSLKDKKHFFGYKYLNLRDEFLFAKKTIIKKDIQKVLIVFGGTDPNETTQKVINYINEERYEYLHFTIIVGHGNKNYEKIIEKVKNKRNIKVLNSVNRISEFISNSDLMISSNGRTVYEACCIGTPLIVISQNERELMHTFGKVSKTTINLGLYSSISKKIFQKNFDMLISDFEYRKRINQRMLSYDLTKGTNRILKKIFDVYKESNL